MRAFILVLLLALTSVASDSSFDLEVKIIEKIIDEISIDKEKIIWSDNKEILESMKKNRLIRTTLDCKKATIIILQEKKNLPRECSEHAIFVLDYKLLSQVPKSFGAFFWKKGRPNIVILKTRLKNLFIHVSNDLEPYLEERAW